MPTICQRLLLFFVLQLLAVDSSQGQTVCMGDIPPKRAEFLEYQAIYEAKLFVTPGEVARYVFLPGLFSTEKSVAISQSGSAADGGPVRFVITATRASDCLWFAYQDENAKEALGRVKISRKDAPIPESTARAIQQLWLAAINAAGPPIPLGWGGPDRSTEILSTVTASGETIRAEIYGFKCDNELLFELVDMLTAYCALPVAERANAAKDIEDHANRLLSGIKKDKREKGSAKGVGLGLH